MARGAAEKTFDTLGEVLEAVEAKADDDRPLSIAEIQEVAGHRAFGPLLLLPGLAAITPLSGIPTVPSMIGAIVMLISLQVVFGRRDVWLPRRLAKAAIDGARVRKAIAFASPIARRVDRVVRRRLVFATEGIGLRVAAAVCFLTAATMPPLEILPFAATSAGSVIAVFGLAITVHDGLLIVVAGLMLILFAVLGYVIFT